MRTTLLIVAALWLLVSPLSAQTIDVKKLDSIDAVAAEQIAKGNVPGAVVLIVQDQKTVFRKAFGLRAKKPTEEMMTVDTIFDLASVTKPVATATSIHLLMQQGKLKPSDKVSLYWPEFAANGKGEVTVEHCLLHTTGLTADNAINDYKKGRAEALVNVAKLPLEVKEGTRFKYSDVGFIVLGELVNRISGKPVDQFAAENIFKPLGMTDTGYNPKESKRIAPTGLRDGETIRGTVHDPRAFAMDGVAGHAGLFGTADDLAIYAKMLLNGGEKILTKESVERFTKPVSLPGSGSRSLGWDVQTSFSSQRGEVFPPGSGYGHTGFTGTSIWIDPPSKTAIIILTNRVHPDDKGNASELRKKIGTIVGGAITPRSQEVSKAFDGATVLTGIDVLKADQFAALKGKTIGLVTNHTGRDRDGSSTIDLLATAPNVKLAKLFSPEHGIRGEKDEKVGDGTDEKTGLPVYSLYGERRKPTVEQLKGLDAVVYDIQDIGCRFYTYISTLKNVMEIAEQANVPVIVLDRPNPIGGVKIEGPLTDAGRESFVGCHSLPLRHGLTVGELAKLFQAESFPKVKLTVVACKDWRRAQTWDQTGLPWRNPSPNMRHLTAAMLYPGVGMLETTNISVGRGTERPFEWIGAPWINGKQLAYDLNGYHLPGVRFVPVERTPNASVYKDKLCSGVDIIANQSDVIEPVMIGFRIAETLRRLYPKEWETKRLDTLLINKAMAGMIIAADKPIEMVSPDIDSYRKRIERIKLYE